MITASQIDLDELERLAKAAVRSDETRREAESAAIKRNYPDGGFFLPFAPSFLVLDPAAVLELIAEVRRLREEAADLWARGHGDRVCAAQCHEEVTTCEICGESNPYRGTGLAGATSRAE